MRDSDVSEDDSAATSDECFNVSHDVFSLFSAREWTHCRTLCARIAEHSAGGNPRSYCRDQVICDGFRDDDATDARALLAGFRGHLGHNGSNERVEFGLVCRNIRTENC